MLLCLFVKVKYLYRPNKCDLAAFEPCITGAFSSKASSEFGNRR